MCSFYQNKGSLGAAPSLTKYGIARDAVLLRLKGAALPTGAQSLENIYMSCLRLEKAHYAGLMRKF